MTEDHYVYKHMEGKEIVYIGCGRLERAWKSDRNVDNGHRDWMRSKFPFLDVVIVAHGLSKKDACAVERKLIHKHAPRFNKCMRDRRGSKLTDLQRWEIATAYLGTVGRKSGDNRYPTQQEIADQYGVSLRTVKKIRRQGRGKGEGTLKGIIPWWMDPKNHI